MWARSFVRLMRDLVGTLDGRGTEGTPAGFRDGLAVQRVMDAVRAGDWAAAESAHDGPSASARAIKREGVRILKLGRRS